MINIDDKVLEQYLKKLEWKFRSSRSEFECVDKTNFYIGLYKITHENKPNEKINCKIGISTTKNTISSYSCEVVLNDIDEAFDFVESRRRDFVKLILEDMINNQKNKNVA